MNLCNHDEEEEIDLADTSDEKNLPKETDREKWDNQLDFLFSMIGYAVDLANLYRFPSVCYENGGGAFLIPYFIMSFTTALPMLYMELLLGQFHQSGALKIWNICPMMSGIGVIQVLMSILVGPFYVVLIAFAFYFLFASFRQSLTWSQCAFEGSTNFCSATLDNRTDVANYVLSTNEYFERHLLKVQYSRGLTELGPIQWPIVGCVFLTLALMWMFLMSGIRASGKIVYFLALVPYLVLFILLINSFFLDGSVDGIKYLFTPNFSKLLDFKVWYAAAVQIFFSTGVGFGVHISFSSFSRRNHNFVRDCWITSLANSSASLLSGLVVFAYLGNLAQVLHRDITDVLNAGPTLVFQVYPFALTTMPGSVFWTLLFFFLLICLGMDSMMGAMEAVLTGINDLLPEHLTKKKHWRKCFVAIVLTTIFLLSIVNTTSGGILVVTLMDKWAAGPIYLLAVFFQVVTISWVYGMDTICREVKFCLGSYPGWYWRICWKFIAPLTLSIVALYTLIEPFEQSYEFQSYYREWENVTGFNQTTRHYTYPKIASIFICIGLLLEFSPVPIAAIVCLIKYRKNLWLAISPVREHHSIINTGHASRAHWRHYFSLGLTENHRRTLAIQETEEECEKF